MGVVVDGKSNDQLVDEMARRWSESRRRLESQSAEQEQLERIKNKVQVFKKLQVYLVMIMIYDESW